MGTPMSHDSIKYIGIKFDTKLTVYRDCFVLFVGWFW